MLAAHLPLTSTMSKHKPWNLEIYRDFDSDFTEDQLLVNRPIREFLEREDKFFLAGAKGLGKTLFLRYKSYLYHNRYGSAMQFNVSHTELSENLYLHVDTFSKEELLGFRDESIWSLIWEVTLWTVLFRLFKLPINPRLEKIVGNSSQVSVVLGHLLNHRSKIEQYRAFAGEFLDQKTKIQSGIVLFIDDVDQAFHNLLHAPHYTDLYQENGQNPSVEVWVNAQMGLVGAVYNLNRQNAHIKIYATIRREAFEAYEGQLKINYRHHICLLQYSKAEIREIFEKNIQLIPHDQLLDRYAPGPVGRFLGFDEFPHRFAIGPDEKSRIEEAFSFIYRHTYGRPREIVLMGNEINALVDTPVYARMNREDRYGELRILVNRVSNELFQQYKQEIIPYLDESRLENFIKNVSSNVIVKEDFRRFDLPLLHQYFNLGFLGYVRQTDPTGLLHQVFHPPATYNYRKFHPLPETDYLVIHSTLDGLLVEQHYYGGFYNRYNIIGDGYTFYPRVDRLARQTDEYIPADVSGGRMYAVTENSGQRVPLRDLYTHFFDFDQPPPRRLERFHMHWRTAEQVLNLLGRICYCHRLERQFRTGFYEEKKQQYLSEMRQHNYSRQYNAELTDAHSEQAHDRFLNRLVGRFITLGCYLVLDLRIEWIYGLLRNGSFEFKPHDKIRDTAMSYLSRGFFIRDLRTEEPRRPDSHEHRQHKQRMFSYLSKFEQDSLRNFIHTAAEEVSHLGWIENPVHKAWLDEHVLLKMWRPE